MTTLRDFLYSGHRANKIKATVIRLNVCIGLVLKREARHTQANSAALNEKVRETLLTKKTKKKKLERFSCLAGLFT